MLQAGGKMTRCNGVGRLNRSGMAEEKKKRPKRRRWLRRLGYFTAFGAVSTLGLWVAVHEVEGLGPAIADGLRSVLGPRAVAWMEDVAYGAQDEFNQWRYKDAAPKTFWEAPTASSDAAPIPSGATSAAADGPPARPAWIPEPFAAPHPSVATPADGIWVPIEDPALPAAPIAMYKSMVHPDERRSFAALAVVAIDVSAFELHLVAGTTEPFSMRVRREDRPGKIPAEHLDLVPAAFNGGFKATHGHYGMLLDGIEYLPPRGIACTFVRYDDGHFRIGTYSTLESEKDQFLFYRQTPPCLVEDGKVHEKLVYNEYAKGGGATVSGETIIRRSAIGISADGKTLFYGLGEAMTAQSLARGMHAAGAHAAAELDVNHSYPRFLFYERKVPDEPPVATHAIIPGIKYPKDQYVTRPSNRDFFYLTRHLRKQGKGAVIAPRRDGKVASKKE